MTWRYAVKASLILLNFFGHWLPDDYRVVVILITTLVLFGTEVIPPLGSSVLILILIFFHYPAVGVQEVFSGFRSPVLYFLLATTAMGTALSRSSLAVLLKNWLFGRLANQIPATLLVTMMLPPTALAVPSSITRNAMLYPVFRDLAGQGIKKADARDIFLVLGMLNPLASSALLTGGLAPLISSDLLGGFGWWRWLALMGIPYYILILSGAGYLLARRVREGVDGGPGPFPAQTERVSFKKDDYVLGGILILVILLWSTDFWHGFHPVVPALIGFSLVLIFYPPAGWAEIQQSKVLENMIILGVLFSLINIAQSQGFMDHLCRGVADQFPQQLPVQAALLLIVAMAALFHLFIPNISVCLTILLPLVATVSPAAGINPVVAGLVTTMTVDTLNYYPAQSTPLLMVYDGNFFRPLDVLKFGLAMTAIFTLALFLVILPYWTLLGLNLRM